MKRRSPTRPINPDQLRIDWTAAAEPPATPTSSFPTAPAFPEPPAPIAARPATHALVQILPWDFQTTFPPVLEVAIDSMVITKDDALPENLPVLHSEHAGEMLAVLDALEAVEDARRRGIDPATGKPPRSQATKQNLTQVLTQEVDRLDRWWRSLLDTYESVFGATAAEAFDKFVRARHAGIEIAVDPRSAPSTPRSPVEMPVPRALRQSVNAGVFGQDENGVVDPSEDEITAITQNHAEAMVELVEIFR